MGSKKNELIGLDIGTHSVKLVQLAEKKGKYTLKKFHMAPIAPEAIVDGAVMDSGSIIEVVREMILKNSVKIKKVAISISGYSVIIKKISLNYMSEEELAESIEWEAAQYIPFDIEDVNIDFQILGENPENPEQMNVLLVAAKKDIINDYETLMLESGLEAAIIDVDSFALETMYENTYENVQNEVVALINIGSSMINFNIMKDGISALTRDVSMGGKQITEEIQKQYGLQYEEAEELKVGPEENWTQHSDLGLLIKSSSENFATEIQRSLDFFYANYPEDRVDRIVLCGGVAKTKGLMEMIEERLSIPTILVNPFNSVRVSAREFDPGYLDSIAPLAAVGVGLAMRKVGDR
jgi:type IV pilus assembly protein PilM